jgi:hypothetical protein
MPPDEQNGLNKIKLEKNILNVWEKWKDSRFK